MSSRAVIPDTSLKDHSWQIKRYHPVRSIDDLADAEVPADAAQHIGMLCAEPLSPAEQVDHFTHGIL